MIFRELWFRIRALQIAYHLSRPSDDGKKGLHMSQAFTEQMIALNRLDVINFMFYFLDLPRLKPRSLVGLLRSCSRVKAYLPRYLEMFMHAQCTVPDPKRSLYGLTSHED